MCGRISNFICILVIYLKSAQMALGILKVFEIFVVCNENFLTQIYNFSRHSESLSMYILYFLQKFAFAHFIKNCLIIRSRRMKNYICRSHRVTTYMSYYIVLSIIIIFYQIS